MCAKQLCVNKVQNEKKNQTAQTEDGKQVII
jgi:hypothetical protein